MKNYREIADSVFARRDAYIVEQRRKKQVIARTTVSVGSVALVSLAGFALYKNGGFREKLPVADGTPTTTTTTATPTQTQDTTTATTTTPTQTEDTTTATTTGESTTPSKTNPTQTTATTSGKTEPTKTTTTPSKTESTQTTTAPTKMLITVTEPDYEFAGEALCSRYRIYISSRLRHYMEMFEGEDVNYAVIVSIPPLSEDYEESKVCNEELVYALQEYRRVYDLYAKEAKQLNPSWSGASSNEIEVWTDTMRANYEQYLLLLDRYRSLAEQYKGPYIQDLLNDRFAVMQEMSASKLVDIECYELSDAGFTWHAYYAELSAETIQALTELGGYTFRLASRNDYGYWQVDE